MVDRIGELELVSNGYRLSNAPDRLGRLQPSDPAESRDVLWQRYQEHGYLWLKGILNRGEVLDFRRRFFEAFDSINMIAPDTHPVDGIWSGFEMPNINKHLVEIVRWASYEAFCLAAPIWKFYEMFLGGPVYLHKRKMIRHGIPYESHSTGGHYDLIYLRGGTERICTSWIPIGDTSVEMGGLIYLEGSDAWGRKLEAEFKANNSELPPDERINAYNKNMKTGWLYLDLATLADQLNARWLVADYEAGDMMVHSPYMVHASTVNIDPQHRIRLSTDIRYQLVRDEIDVRWANHWTFDDML